MNQALLKKIESEQFRKDDAKFAVGDSVKVHTKVVEGDKERIQIFSGRRHRQARHRPERDVQRAPHQLRRRCGTHFPAAFAPRGQGGSRARRFRAPRQADLPPQTPRQRRDFGQGKDRKSHRYRSEVIFQIAAIQGVRKDALFVFGVIDASNEAQTAKLPLTPLLIRPEFEHSPLFSNDFRLELTV